MPEFEIEISNDRINAIKVVRGAPCEATWKAAEKIIGLSVEEALSRIGLETQFFCSADSANWDPLHGKSPIHFAGDLHIKALKRALKKNSEK